MSKSCDTCLSFLHDTAQHDGLCKEPMTYRCSAGAACIFHEHNAACDRPREHEGAHDCMESYVM